MSDAAILLSFLRGLEVVGGLQLALFNIREIEADVTLELEDGESVTLDFSDVKKCKLKPTYDFKPAKEGK